MEKFIIADSGSTKTDWCLMTEHGDRLLLHTQGINPFHQEEQQIAAILTQELLPQLGGRKPEAVFFYGSGCRPELQPMMRRLLADALPEATTIEAHGDLLGAARAVCGHQAGQACILGTGANSCLYDGTAIVQNTPPMGYILGDEGSGAVMGRLFVSALFRGELPQAVADDFAREQRLTMAEVIERVYRQPMANRFLASLSPFIHSHCYVPEVARLVTDNLRSFFRHHLAPYGRRDLPVGCVGSIAYHYRQQVEEAAQAEGFTIARILPSPINGLADYHGETMEQ